ncbi:MAG: DNA alkylation repair protein [Syntrophomonadaceae bacterium]|nr:DNA alkylation repair protein [Syntrophomonadaceae bacterium]MDD3024350.1 DNA alkylation repair protein [Syntrophomonadaceae bacterium]
MLYPEMIKVFYEHRDSQKAEPMAAYMKNKFFYLGIPKPERSRLQREFINKVKKEKTIDWKLLNTLWELPEREFQYLAIDYLIALSGSLSKGDIENIEFFIISKSWWDTVDLLASKIIGKMCAQYPELISTHIVKWSEIDNIWLIRTAILFQLKFKEKTDTQLLDMIISKNSQTKEFFINKAIGWILREYSKSNQEWVRNFLNSHHLHSLSVREASKYL